MHYSPKHPDPLPYAPIWRRIAALVYDSLILLAISMVYGAVAIGIHVAIYGTGSDDYQPRLTGLFFQLGWLISLMGFYVFFWRKAGQTAGMRAWRLTLIGGKNQLPSHKQAIIRGLISPILVPTGIAYLWKWIDPNGLCLHDKLSNTKVLLEPKRKKKK